MLRRGLVVDDRMPPPGFAPEVAAYYAAGGELNRLDAGRGALERVRTQELLARHLPPPPAVVLDVGGAAGVYACWLAALGYAVHLIDPVPLHVEQARGASASQPGAPLASIALGDARDLAWPDGSVDAVMLLGPLYHLPDPDDRRRALAESRRVLRPGGAMFAAAISRFAPLLDGLRRGFLDDAVYGRIVERGLIDGQHRNEPGRDYFTTAYLHLPDELAAEVRGAGFELVELVGLEGPGGNLPPDELDRWWGDPTRRERLLAATRLVEQAPALVGASSHLLAVGRRPAD
jgi:SAM-dependent methyltransferase